MVVPDLVYLPLIPAQAVTVLRGDTILAVAGCIDWDGKSVLWATFTPAVRPRDFLPMHRRAERAIRQLLPAVVQVDKSIPQNVRWARTLKFTETGMTVEHEGRLLTIMERSN